MAQTPLAAGTDVSDTIGGKEYSRATLKDTTGADAMGLVAATPAANTLLGRLKALVDAIFGQAPADDIFAIAPNDGADLPTTPRSLLILTDGNLQVKGTGAAVTIPVKAGMILPLKAKRIYATNTTATVAGLA